MSLTISHPYFPAGLRYTTIAALVFSAWLIYAGHRKSAAAITVVSIFVLTAKYSTIIDLEKKEYTDAFYAFGIDFNSEKKSFNRINSIVVTKGSYSQMLSSRISQRQLDWTDYTGTLVYDDTGELPLITHEEKKKVMETLKVYATALKCEIEDRSVRRA